MTGSLQHCTLLSVKMSTSGLAPTVILLALIAAGGGARILGVFPMISKSHMILNSALLTELARRGHEVTIYSPFPDDQAMPNVTSYVIGYNILSPYYVPSVTSAFQIKDMNMLQFMEMLWIMGEYLSENMMKDVSIQKLLNSKDHFDIVMLDAAFNECLMGFAHKFKAHLMQICSYGGSPWMDGWLGNPTPYAYVPDSFLGFSDRMNFWERLLNTLTGTAFRLGRHYYHLPKQEALMRKYFNQTKDLPSIYELETTTSLLLLNSHFSISYPKPLMSKMVQVGGMHIKPPQKLPKDLQEFLDDAKDGAIYFSMGTVLRGADFSEEHRKVFLQVFSKVKQKVLWKWEEDSIQGQSKNVRLAKWLPQSDVLAHPNVRVFITHGGLLSSQEGIARGVPLIGIPIFGDQNLNMKRAVRSGYGILLAYENISVSSLSWALDEALHNPIYTQNAKKMSKLYQDQPMTPLETAVYWTEYVLRHNGTSHMRSAAVDLHWYQYHLLDVITFLALATIGLLLTSFVLLRALYRMCTRKSEATVSQKMKRN